MLAGATITGDAVALPLRVMIDQGMLACMAVFASLPSASGPCTNHRSLEPPTCRRPCHAELVNVLASVMLNYPTTQVGGV